MKKFVDIQRPTGAAIVITSYNHGFSPNRILNLKTITLNYSINKNIPAIYETMVLHSLAQYTGIWYKLKRALKKMLGAT